MAGLPRDVVRVGAGHYHSLAVTAGGEVWTWGRNADGQLGHVSDGGTNASTASLGKPAPVESLSKEKVLSFNLAAPTPPGHVYYGKKKKKEKEKEEEEEEEEEEGKRKERERVWY